MWLWPFNNPTIGARIVSKSVKATMKNACLVIISMILFSCAKDSSTASLRGKWVEINTKTDTLTFGLLGDKESMFLGRGKEMSNGYLTPKSHSGPYDYRLLVDKISLRWLLSASDSFNEFYFSLSGDKIIIENFYDSNAKGILVTFKRIN